MKLFTRAAAIFSLTTLIAVASPVAQAARTVPLYAPQPIQLEATLQQSTVGEAVSDSLINAGWRLVARGKNEIHAEYRQGGYLARLRVRFSNAQVRLSYLDSQNLSYHMVGDHPQIFGAYNRWVRDFEEVLRFRLTRLAEREPVKQTSAPVKMIDVTPKRQSQAKVRRVFHPTTKKAAKVETREVNARPVDQNAGEVKSDIVKAPEVKKVLAPEKPSVNESRIALTENSPEKTASPDDKTRPIDAQTSNGLDSSANDLGELKW